MSDHQQTPVVVAVGPDSFDGAVPDTSDERTRETTRTSSAHLRPQGVRRFVGGVYLVAAGINTGIALADPSDYRHFADGAALSFVRRAWADVVMASPTSWVLLLAAGELVLGVLLLRGGKGARIGWIGVLLFQVLLMFFGPGTWLWSLPVLAVLTPVARADWTALAPASPPATQEGRHVAG